MTVDQDQVERWLRKWQPRLRLADWDITISLKRLRDMSIEDAMGSCAHTLKKRIAHIEILDPIDYPATALDQDAERTVAHELLHCLFAPFEARERSSAKDIAQEQAIHAISTALVNVDRNPRS